jgi:transcription antitermination factor NusG
LFYEKRPAQLYEEEIEIIRLSLKAPERIKLEKSNFCKGDTVMITRGVFEGIRGLITEIRGNYKLTVNLYEMSMSINIVLNPNEVELLKNI